MYDLDNLLDFDFKIEFLNVDLFNSAKDFLLKNYNEKDYAIWSREMLIYTSSKNIVELLKKQFKPGIILKEKILKKTKNANTEII